MLLLICLVVVVASVVYTRMISCRFSRHGVNYKRPVPFLGNALNMALKKTHISEDFQTTYDAFPNDRFVGRFDLMKPVVMIRDIDLIKQITVKDFEHFLDHRMMVDETVDTLFGRSLFSLKGQEWKDMRSTMSPVFTSAKMRAMVPFMVDVSQQTIQLLKSKINTSQTDYVDVDAKDLMTRYTNDVIASCGFGLKVDSTNEENNEFYVLGKSSAHFGFKRVLVYLGYMAFPAIMKKLKLKLFSGAANDYFRSLFYNTMAEREKSKVVRPDMIHIFIESKKGNVKSVQNPHSNDAGFATVEESEVGRRTVTRSWPDSDFMAQAVFFFLASFETIASAMCFLFYELALNPDVQKRLVEELRECEAKGEGFNYNSVQDLKYLDMVVSELLRMWPFGVAMDRLCTKNYNLGKPNEEAKNDYIIKAGEIIIIPIKPIHHNPKYYPDPEKFDPERFSEQNRVNIKPYTYLPFGSGPRNCIGSRFALLELKVMIYHLLLQFEVSPAERTRIPATLVPGGFLLTMEGGHWIRFKSRV